MEIGSKLRHRRVELGLSRNQLAKELRISPSAIANYENDISYPKPDILIALMIALNIDANYLFLDSIITQKIEALYGQTIANYENDISYPKPDILIALMIALNIDANYLFLDSIITQKIEALYGQTLSPEEQHSIQKYKELPAESKHLIHMIINEEFNRCHGTRKWIEFSCIQPGRRRKHFGFLLRELPAESKHLIHMIINEEFNRCHGTRKWIEFSCIQPGRRRKHFGFLLREGAPTDKIRIKKKHVVEGMDFCFQIHVDQYNPIFKKHDILILKKQPASHNEIGIFCLNEIYYIRTLYQIDGVRRLRALNVVEPDIEIDGSDSFICIGTVIGLVHGPYELYSENKAGAK